MKNIWLTLLAITGGMATMGCGNEMPGTTRPLGTNEYALAFTASRDVLSGYFSIEAADADSGLIRCRPASIESPSERLISGARPARHLCTMQLQEKDDGVYGTLSIAIQRKGSEVYQSFRRSEDNYRGIPDQTPAQVEGATTPEQNDIWTTTRQDKTLELRLLGEILDRTRPAEMPTVQTQPR